MSTRIYRVGLSFILLLSTACTESKESSIAKQRQLSTTPSSIVVHSEFGIDPFAALSGEDPDLAYNVGLQSPIDFPPSPFTPPINGGVHLVVWSDGGDLYGERLSGDGSPLEPGRFVISASDGSQTHPRVAPIDIEQYAVVFEDDRNGGSIYVTHVDIYGNVTGETPIVAGVGEGSSPAVGCAWVDPTIGDFSCFVVWRNGSEIIGEPFVWVGSTFLTHEPMAISNAIANGSAVISAPAIAANAPSSTGQNYLVAWNQSPTGGNTVDVHAARLSVPNAVYPPPDSGQPPPVILEQPEITVSQDTAALTAPSVAAGYLVSWVKSTGASTGAVVAARVTLDGSVLDSTPLSLGSIGTSHGASPPSGLSSGLVVWVDDQSSVNGARVTQTGEVVTLGRIASAPPGGSLAHARGMTPAQNLPSTGGGALDIVVWTQNGGATDPSDRLFAATRNADGLSFNPPFGIVGAGTPVGAAVTGNASEFLVLWSGNGIRIGKDGRALDAHPFAAPTGAVTSDGTDFAVVWSASGDIHGSKIGRNGAVGADTTIIAGPNPEESVAIASNGSNYVLVWLEQDPANEGKTILHEGVLDLDLHVQQTIVLASDQSNFILSPAVASDGDGYMAVWSEESLCPPPGCSVGAFQIYGIGFQADGSLSPDSGFWFPVGEPGLDEFSPSIAPAGGPGAGYVVAYTERSGNSKGEIRALRALHVWPPVMGAPAPEVLTIGNPNLYEDSPSVARLCDENLVTWTRGDYTVSDYPPGPRDLIGATIANGTATELPISNTTNDESAPATFGLGPSALVVYSTFAGVRARLVTAGCGGSTSDGGGGGGAPGAGGVPGAGGATGFDGGVGAQTGSGGQAGLPDASSNGGATDAAAAGGANDGAAAAGGASSGGQAGAPDASGTGGSTDGGLGGANQGDAGLDANGNGGAGGSGSGGESNGGSGGQGKGGHAGFPAGNGGHAGKGGADAGTPGHGHGKDGRGCQTAAQTRSSTTGASALALIALSVVRRRSVRRRILT